MICPWAKWSTGVYTDLLHSIPKSLPCYKMQHQWGARGSPELALGCVFPQRHCQLPCAGVNGSHQGCFQSLFGVWHVSLSSRTIHDAAQQTFLPHLFQKQSKAYTHSYKVLTVNLSGVSILSDSPRDKLLLHQRWQRLSVQHSWGKGASLDVWRDCNLNPNSLERLLKDPVHHLAKHPGFAKKQNSHSPGWCLPRFDRLKAQPFLKRTVKPSHFFLFHSGKWI